MHGLSVFGDLKYPADFHHFDYVNLDAPKGGLFSLIPSVRSYNQSFYTFNSFNAYILKGEAAQGMDPGLRLAEQTPRAQATPLLRRTSGGGARPFAGRLPQSCFVPGPFPTFYS